MAYLFTQEIQGTLKGRATTSTDTYTLKGVNSTMEAVAAVVNEANKILKVFGKTMAADDYCTMTVTKISEDND